jgi:hypothetical protein
MALPVGTIVKNSAGVCFLIETSSKRQFPDAGTLAALTIGITIAPPTVTDAALAAVASGAPFPSVAAYAAANLRIAATIRRIVSAMEPTGLANLAGGLMTIAEAAAALYADAIANPAGWAAPIVGASKKQPLPATFSTAATQIIVKLLNGVLNKLLNSALSDTQSSSVGQSVDDTATDASGADDPTDPLPKDTGEKEDPKEAGDKEAGEKEAGEKEAGDKDAGDKDAGDKDAGDKDAGDKDAGDKDQKDDKEQEKDDQDKADKDDPDKSDKDDQDKNEKDDKDADKDPEDGGDGGGPRAPVPRHRNGMASRPREDLS